MKKKNIVRICPECKQPVEQRCRGSHYSCENPDCIVFSVSYANIKPQGSIVSRIIYVSLPRVVIT